MNTATKATHTPGPWTIGPEATSVGHLVYVPIKYRNRSTIKASQSGITSSVYAHNDNGECVGKEYVDKFGDTRHRETVSADEARANAHLIAAAPEMLEVLEFIARDAGLLAGHASKTNDAVLLNSMCEFQRRCDAAIRKARGEQ